VAPSNDESFSLIKRSPACNSTLIPNHPGFDRPRPSSNLPAKSE
jgi:hypothetical protein